MGSAIEIRFSERCHCTRGGKRAGICRVRASLTVAEPEGYVRVFVDEGAPMAALLSGVSQGVLPRRA